MATENAFPGYTPRPEARPGVFTDTPLTSADVLMAEDELLNMLSDWGEAVAEITAPTYEDVTPPGEEEGQVKKK